MLGRSPYLSAVLQQRDPGHPALAGRDIRRTPDGSYLPVYETLGLEESPAPYDPRSEWIQTLESLDGRFLWDTYYDGNYEYIRASKIIYDNRDFSNILGTISVEFNYEHLTQSVLHNLRNEAGMEAALYNIATEEFIGYYSIRGLPDTDTLRQLSASGGFYIQPDGDACLFARRLSTTDYYLVGLKSLEEVHTTYLQSCSILFLSAGAALLVGMLLTFVVTGSVMRPVVQLSETMKNVKNGDLDITVHTREKGEVGELYDSFNYMIQMINQLIEENYVTRLNQKQSELNALQSQINTHFLYNTLDSINWAGQGLPCGTDLPAGDQPVHPAAHLAEQRPAGTDGGTGTDPHAQLPEHPESAVLRAVPGP